MTNADNTIQGQGAIGANTIAVTNQALIDANVSGQTLTLDPVGTAADAGLTFDNQGTLQASGGGILVLTGSGSGAFTNTGGTIQALAGSEVRLTGGASITGGTLTTAGDGVIRLNTTASLTGLTNSGTFVTNNNTDLSLNGAITNSGTITVNTTGSTTDIVAATATTLDGAGTVTLAGGANARILGTGGVRLTNADNTIQGQGAIGANTIAITNQAAGLIDANVSGQTLVIDPANVANAFLNEGTLRASGGGIASLTGSGLGGFTNNGTFEALDGSTLQMVSSAVLTNLSGGTLTGGTYRVIDGGAGASMTLLGTAVDTIATGTTVELSGAISVFTAGGSSLQSTLTTNNGTLRVADGRTLSRPGSTLSNSGLLDLRGGNLDYFNLLNDAGAQLTGFGTIDLGSNLDSSGDIVADGGTLTVNGPITGDGTVTINAAAALDLSGAGAASTASTLAHNGTDLNLGANDITVSADYTNANFGVGNAFDARANVTGAGQILAAGDVDQTITGDGSTGTLAFGNVHVGDTNTLNYQVANDGTTGPDLRGAIQTTANGGNVTDARLSGTGVTAANFGPIATGADTGNLAVTFTATSAGALTGQTVHIENNFDNVAGDDISITGAAFRLANPTAHTPEPVVLANQHVGDSLTQALSISNTAPADGFSEGLDAAFTATTDDATTGGAITNLAAGGTDTTTLQVGVDTTTAGAKSGTATLGLDSNGAGTSGLGITALASQTVNVSGDVYRLAAPSAHAPEPVNLGVVHIGETPTQALTLSNTAAADMFSEALNASFTATSGDATASGTFDFLAAGATDSTSLTVGIDTASVGNKTGTATIGLVSNGTGTSDLGQTDLPSQTVNIQAQVNFFAEPVLTAKAGDASLFMISATEFTLDFGQVAQNSGTLTGSFGVLNFLRDAVFQDALGGTFDIASVTNFTLSGFGAFSGIAPGSDLDPDVMFDTTMAQGLYTDMLFLNPTSSNASGASDLAAITLNLRAEVVPEPSTALLLALGALGLAVRRRRLNRRDF